jgi:hypothetical protein
LDRLGRIDQAGAEIIEARHLCCGFGSESITQKIGRSNYQRAVFLESSRLAFGIRKALDFREQRAQGVFAKAQPVEGEKVMQHVTDDTTIDGFSILIALE